MTAPLWYFRERSTSDGPVFEPGENSAGPWAPDMMHGRFFGGLAAREVERLFVDDGFRVSRLTVDMFKSAPIDDVFVEAAEIRRGRRIRVVDVMIRCGGHEVAAVRAVILAEGEQAPGEPWAPEPWVSPHPDELPPMPSQDQSKQSSAWVFRIHEGGIRSSDRSRVWTRDDGVLVEGEAMSPLVRATLSADLASPLANGTDLGVGYINADYTLAMARYPVGSWVGLEASTHQSFDGIALGAATLYDLDGPFATSTTTAVSNPLIL